MAGPYKKETPAAASKNMISLTCSEACWNSLACSCSASLGLRTISPMQRGNQQPSEKRSSVNTKTSHTRQECQCMLTVQSPSVQFTIIKCHAVTEPKIDEHTTVHDFCQ